jgi:hypothetical protein
MSRLKDKDRIKSGKVWKDTLPLFIIPFLKGKEGVVVIRELPFNFLSPVDWSGRHADSCGIAAEMLRPHSAEREEAQLRPAEGEVPGTQINRLHLKGKLHKTFLHILLKA